MDNTGLRDSREKSIHAHADADMYKVFVHVQSICTCTVFRHSTCINILHGYICKLPKISISAYFSCQNFVGARPL